MYILSSKLGSINQIDKLVHFMYILIVFISYLFAFIESVSEVMRIPTFLLVYMIIKIRMNIFQKLEVL